MTMFRSPQTTVDVDTAKTVSVVPHWTTIDAKTGKTFLDAADILALGGICSGDLVLADGDEVHHCAIGAIASAVGHSDAEMNVARAILTGEGRMEIDALYNLPQVHAFGEWLMDNGKIERTLVRKGNTAVFRFNDTWVSAGMGYKVIEALREAGASAQEGI